MELLVRLATLVGVLTTYSAARYGGGPLYCDRGEGWTYREELRWIALPSGVLEPRGWQCGDLVRVVFEDGTSFWAAVLDTGPFDRYYVEQFGRLPIVGDVPEHLWPYPGALSARGRVFNESMYNRMAGDAKMGHRGRN